MKTGEIKKREKKNNFASHLLLVGSEVSGTELGRADYDPIPRSYI